MTTVETAARALTRRVDTHVTARITAAALLFGVAYIHLADQGFLAFDKSPGYLRPAIGSWLLAAGCAAGPLAGFILTRSVGLPGATEDIGNWGEPLGVASLIVEGTLLLVAAAELGRLVGDRAA